MREIDVKVISDAVAELCIKSNLVLPEGVKQKLSLFNELEEMQSARDIFGFLIENYKYAEQTNIPICQDTGIAVVFVKLGREIHLTGGNLYEAINEGVRNGYTRGYLRCSVVSDPLYDRANTKDNTPAIIYTEITEGDKIEITVAPKGFGSENMSNIKMMNPAASEKDVIEYVTSVVRNAGSKACPPMVVGVGIGGDFEYCAYLAKKALCRDIELRNKDIRYKNLEEKILDSVNKLGIGPQGQGGKTTALAINIEWAPTHIASLPVAVNIGCHATRHASREL